MDREWPAGDWKTRPTIRTQRTKLQSALLAHVPPGVIRLSKKLDKITDLGEKGVELQFADGTSETAELVVGADGIRSVCWLKHTADDSLPTKFTKPKDSASD